MLKLFRYLKSSAGYVAMIVLLLFLQAYCDLSLPSYTSNIVNVGIQQKGVEDGVPEQISSESLEALGLFMSESDYETVMAAYEENDGIYELADVSKDEREELNSIMGKPELILSTLTSDEETVNKIKEQMSLSGGMGATNVAGTSDEMENTDAAGSSDEMENTDAAGSLDEMEITGETGISDEVGISEEMDILDIIAQMPADTKETMLASISEQIDQMPESIITQSAVAFVQNEYESLGIDMDDMQMDYLVQTGIRMLGMALLLMLAAVCVTFLSARVAATVGHDLRNDVYRKVIGFSNGEYNQFSTASLITRSTNDIQQVQMMMAMIFRIACYAPILAIGGIFKALRTNVSMSWIIALAVIVILMVILILLKVAMPKFKMLQTLIDRVNLVTREILTGVPVIRAFSREKHEEERFEEANRNLMKTNLFVNRCMTFMMPVIMLVMNSVSLLIVYKGSYAVDAGTMQVGDMMAFIQYAMQIIMSFLMLTMLSIMLPRAAVSGDRINEILETEATIHDPKQPKTPSETVKGKVEFDHVSFAYPDADENILTDINFTAEKGETVAIIGSTGSGKSTVVNLIPRFYDVTKGAVRVDGVDVREMTQKDLRDRLGYVPQKGVLFSGTIDSNIRFGRPDATKEEVEEAARIAQAEEFILEKPDQYDSHIAQGGTNVSGGQKQRLSIARAIEKKPEILIFDDSFSALDYKTDVALRKALKEATAETTTIIVAQRISTILHADKIIVLNEGEMAGIGTHKELMQSCEVYQQIARSQLSEEELA